MTFCTLASALIDSDLRILPTTDSRVDLTSDDNTSVPCHVLPAPACVDKQSGTYARGHAWHQMPFLQPSESDACPLQCSDSGVAYDGCHGEF